MKCIKKIINKYLGSVQYLVNVRSCDGTEGKRYVYDTELEVDECIKLFNTEKYWSVINIEKIRKFDFVYNKEVKHYPLWFDDSTTERIDELSFYKPVTSLSNVINGDFDYNEE